MKVLGLDLGVGSIGWALIEIDDNCNPIRLIGIGSRVISLTPDDQKSFTSSKGVTKCSQRTVDRTIRKGYDRYQMRRKTLNLNLAKLGMLDPENRLHTLSTMQLWQLRADAASRQISLIELGRVLSHINQKRGYRHVKEGGDGKAKDYVANINQRYAILEGKTIGQFFAQKLKESETIAEDKDGRKVCTYNFRIKGEILPRKAYQEEFDRIMEMQRQFYPNILDEDNIKRLKEIIFFQRPLKSCKHLVSICDKEKRVFLKKVKDGWKEVEVGPKVAPVSSPIAQITSIYEAVNNIVLTNNINKRRAPYAITNPDEDYFSLPKDARLLLPKYYLNAEERAKIVEYLSKNKSITESQLLSELKLKNTGFRWVGAPKNGLKGNDTYVQLAEALSDTSLNEDEINSLLRFNLELDDTDDILRLKMTSTKNSKTPRPAYLDEPLYVLWHTIYSSSTMEELEKALKPIIGDKHEDIIPKLFAIDFGKKGYANKSAKVMRKILPFLMLGYKYSDACEAVGINHSDSITKEENEKRVLKSALENLPKGALRQPIVERILNQMINVVNAVKEKYGEIDEIRVELARQLKQSKDERIEATVSISKREKDNDRIAGILKENGIKSTKRNIQKYRIYKEAGKKCIYCGIPLGLNEYFDGVGEIEHIIPRSIFFDDSISNKACSCAKCNREKGNLTGYDYMFNKGEIEFAQYLERIENLYKSKIISKTKLSRFMTPGDKIPVDFLDRDLRQSQYISKKAIELLRDICHNVYASSGTVTDYFRHIWGYDMILHILNIDRYAQADLVEDVEFERNGQIVKEKRIVGWSKRLDHRHHAIDALVIALTRQGYIQRLNNLRAEHGDMYQEMKNLNVDMTGDFHLLQSWAQTRPHLPVDEVAYYVDRIAVSLKSGKKFTTPGKRYIHRKNKRERVQSGLIIPRGSLHNDTIHGKIRIVKKDVSVKELFSRVEMIVDEKIRNAVRERLDFFEGNTKKAQNSLKKSPIRIVKNGKEVEIEKVDCYEDVYAVRKKIASLSKAAFDKIVDSVVRDAVKQRFEECGNNEKKFEQSVTENPIVIHGKFSRPVISTRVYSNAEMEIVKRDSEDMPIGYAQTSGNDHVAFYSKDGEMISICVSMLNALRRRKLGLPRIVTEPDVAWNVISNLEDADIANSLAKTLPEPGSQFVSSMKMGDMFILGLSEDEVNDAFRDNDMHTLSKHLYRVQKLSDNDYYFRLHTWTTVDADKQDQKMKALYRVRSNAALLVLNPIPVNVDCLGQITRRK